jgi:coatomer protein complex subunit alpha (xenin)
VRAIALDGTEYLFKLALSRGQFDRVLAIIKTARLCGQAVIAYLQKAGYPEIALFFVEDEGVRFNLALECGNLDIAQKAARALGSEAAWVRLAAEALRLGNVKVVEEMVNMIIAQRAYEVNTKAISAADEMMQQSNNLKR